MDEATLKGIRRMKWICFLAGVWIFGIQLIELDGLGAFFGSIGLGMGFGGMYCFDNLETRTRQAIATHAAWRLTR